MVAQVEDVLGDFEEGAKSRRQYVKEAVSVFAPVIISRIRRVTDVQVLLMQALALYASFAAAAWYLGESEFLYQRAGLMLLAIPTAVSIAALLIVKCVRESRAAGPLAAGVACRDKHHRRLVGASVNI